MTAATPSDEEIVAYFKREGTVDEFTQVRMNQNWVWVFVPDFTTYWVFCRHQFVQWIDNKTPDPCDHYAERGLIETLFKSAHRRLGTRKERT